MSGYGQPSQIENLLKKDNVQLEELMNEDSFL